MKPSNTGHQSQIMPEDNKFHVGNGSDGKHYWLTPPEFESAVIRTPRTRSVSFVEHPDVVKLTITTHVPDKWLFVDRETGQVWKYRNGTLVAANS